MMAVRTTVRRWSGVEIRALREAQRMSLREFAARLGVSDRMISKWEAGGADIHPRPVNQAALDTLLAHADPDVHTRFALLFSDQRKPPAPTADRPRVDRVAPPEGRIPGSDGHRVRQSRHPLDDKLMSLVEAGRFPSGTDDTSRHLDAFYIDVHPVTNAEYARFVAATGHRPPAHWHDHHIPPGLDEHPVVFVSWHDAHAYATWCGKSLPTSAQWEKAARGADGSVYPWGNQDTPAKCNVRGSGPGTTTPTGQYRSGASPYEVYDLCGNVWEWCADETHSGRRELRGGAFSSPFHRSKPAEFNDASPDMHDDDTGFRCVTLPQELAPSAKTEDMKRRDLLRLIGISGASIALPATELAENETPDGGGLMDARWTTARLEAGAATRTRRPGSTNGLGVVSGHVLKLTREAAGLTQAGLADGLEVDLSTVQGWESGQRPLTGLRARDLSHLRRQLIALGSQTNALALLSEAIEADIALSEVLFPEPDMHWTQRHPLGTTIHQRAVINLITWPFTGTSPDRLSRLSNAASTGQRVPVADRPTLSASDRATFFSNLRDAADRSTTSTNELFRRQATYLVGFDDDPESVRWLAQQHETALARKGNLEKLPNWLALRSSAIAMAQSGDREPLRYFVTSGVSDENGQIANLNYWAYWLGEISELHRNDRDMIYGDSSVWVGDRIAQHLLGRLTSESTYLELTARSLWSLLALRPEIISRRPDLRQLAGSRLTSVLDTADLPNQTRQELASIAYAVRLADR